jgi:hypothetical protein
MKTVALIISIAFVSILGVGSGPVEAEQEFEKVASDAHSQLLLAPFAAPRANFFHAALEVPPFESGRTLDQGAFLLRLRTAHPRSLEERTIDGYENIFNGRYHEWAAFELDWGVTERFELGVRTVFAGWDEHQDRFDILDSNGVPIVTDEYKTFYDLGATKRHDNFSVVGIKAKALLLNADEAGLDLSLATSVKFPIGRPEDLTSAGTYDLAFTVMGSKPFSWGALHANLGVTIPLGSQNLFEPAADVELNPFVHGALGATFALPWEFALGLQLEANSTAFHEVEFLDQPPFAFTLGLRRFLGKFFLEAGGGVGLDWSSAYQSTYFFSVGRLY